MNESQNILDLRRDTTIVDNMRRNYQTPWLAGYGIALLVFAILTLTGSGYLAWLDNGCDLNGIMTLQGKICINK
jgi:hypothetical protein